MLWIVEREGLLPVTEAQWAEHSDAWRWAHLDWAPSAYLRRRALDDLELHERLALGQAATALDGEHGRSTGWPHLALEMMVILVIVAAVAIGAALR